MVTKESNWCESWAHELTIFTTKLWREDFDFTNFLWQSKNTLTQCSVWMFAIFFSFFSRVSPTIFPVHFPVLLSVQVPVSVPSLTSVPIRTSLKPFFALQTDYKPSSMGQSSIMWCRANSCGTEQSYVGQSSLMWDRADTYGTVHSHVGQGNLIWDI